MALKIERGRKKPKIRNLGATLEHPLHTPVCSQDRVRKVLDPGCAQAQPPTLQRTQVDVKNEKRSSCPNLSSFSLLSHFFSLLLSLESSLLGILPSYLLPILPFFPTQLLLVLPIEIFV